MDNLTVPPNMNRFLVRGTHINLAISEDLPAFMFTKMGRMSLFGFIEIKKPRRWSGTKIHVRDGYIGGNIVVPSELFDYLVERATIERNKMQNLSPKQKELIADTLRRNSERAAASETYKAIKDDLRLFGDGAFATDEE
jgi:hypothetical protein